jgi:citrate synthase
MSPKTSTPTTALCRYEDQAVYYRGRDLVGDILQDAPDFTGALMTHILGATPPSAHVRAMNAILIVLMEHGLTPSAIATRSVYMSAPENLQGAVAAGLMAVGSNFVGTMENCAALLARILAAPPEGRGAVAAEIAAEHRAARRPVPGFGHHLHRPDDPRALHLMTLGRELGLDRGHLPALEALAGAVDAAAGRHVTVNATGACAALMGEMGVPTELMRGFAVISRAAGLVAHVAEERERPSGRYIWETIDRAIPYEP